MRRLYAYFEELLIEIWYRRYQIKAWLLLPIGIILYYFARIFGVSVPSIGFGHFHHPLHKQLKPIAEAMEAASELTGYYPGASYMDDTDPHCIVVRHEFSRGLRQRPKFFRQVQQSLPTWDCYMTTPAKDVTKFVFLKR